MNHTMTSALAMAVTLAATACGSAMASSLVSDRQAAVTMPAAAGLPAALRSNASLFCPLPG